MIAANVPAGAHVLELGAGAGRVTHALIARGLRVTAVDDSAEMLAVIHGAETVLASIEGLALGRRFDAVILGSHLVNTPDDAQRLALLRAARDHVHQHGSVLLEHHASEWAQTAEEGESRAGDVTIALREVRRHPPFVSAVAEYRVDGHTFAQPFTARILSDEELAGELGLAGLEVLARPNPRWTTARRARPAT